ncbi:MAG: Two component transcriptional regulator, winged helix family [Parcubacteria group bacterium GW2011_GWF2_38_76]|nr:MAG: Two component transcriptional regulator, winged helix family [Parcubacteria group bacterium GW2011_GWF2_38_76]HBM45530.1 response regulator [Patescibacteria group bacterium]
MDKNVFLIEDDRFLREMLSQKLSEQKIKVDVAMDGKTALEMVKTIKPDLVLSDLLLPDVDGFDILAEIQKNPNFANVPVLVLSNLDRMEDIKRAKDLGAKDFMVKSNFTSNEIVAKVKEFLKI